MLRLLLPFLALGLMGQLPDTIRVTLPAADPRPLVMVQGQSLVVELRGNPTTGFAWELKDLPECLTLKGEPAYVQDPSDERKLGVGGRYLYTFVAEKKGSGTLQFIYRRPWEKDKPPLESARLALEVR
jgi:inhibitor of cysteine peptidase